MSEMSAELVYTVLTEAARAGVREFCVCAGARNALLVAVIQRTAGLRVWSFPEERVAGFFALGRVVATGAPVAVLTTSGTAVAEVLPAVMEAHYQGLPLLVISADRPGRFRRSGAPQAVEQVGIFSEYVEACVDLEAGGGGGASWAEDWSRCRPVHVNVCLEEPTAAELAGATGVELPEEVPVRDFPQGGGGAVVGAFVAQPDGLVVLLGAMGRAERAGVEDFLAKLGAPVWAEAASGLRESRKLAGMMITGGEKALAGLEVGRVLRIGGVPSCRFWRDLEARADVPVLVVTRAGFRGLGRRDGVRVVQERIEWGEVPVPERGRAGKMMMVRDMAGDFPLSEPALVGALSRVIPDGALVFLGNSLPVREWNGWASWEDRGLRCHANRGTNGIDGAVSTFLGLSADEAESWCVVGDLTAIYDLAAPWIWRRLPEAKRRIVIINNAGGKIFRRLPALAGGFGEADWAVMENGHGVDFAGWALLWGMGYRCVSTPEELAEPVEGEMVVVEVRPDGEQTEAFWRALRGA